MSCWHEGWLKGPVRQPGSRFSRATHVWMYFMIHLQAAWQLWSSNHGADRFLTSRGRDTATTGCSRRVSAGERKLILSLWGTTGVSIQTGLTPPEDLPLFSVVGLTFGCSLDCIQVANRRADELYTHPHIAHTHKHTWLYLRPLIAVCSNGENQQMFLLFPHFACELQTMVLRKHLGGGLPSLW